MSIEEGASRTDAGRHALTADARLTPCPLARTSLQHQDAPLPNTPSDPITPFDVAHWIREARRGSQAAFACLYRRFVPLVHGILLARFRPVLADELTQECFAHAFAQLQQLKEDHKFGAWIATMARRIQPSRATPEVQSDVWPEVASSTTSPDDCTEAEQVLRTIASLPEAYRETLLLRLVEGLSGQEIAALTGLTPESVRVNLHRGMEKLRAALDLLPVRAAPAEALHDRA